MNLNLPKANKVVITHSGGLDSSTALICAVEFYGKDRVISVGYNYGQKQVKELEKAQELCDELGVTRYVMDLSILGDIVKNVSSNIQGSSVAMPTIQDVLGDPQPKTEVPYRNMIMLSLTMAFAQANSCDYIFTGVQATDQYSYWDTTSEFIKKINEVSDLNRQHNIQVVAPFSNLSKKQEIQILQDLGKFGLLKHTLTCYDPTEDIKSCGKCPSCSERIKAFKDLNLKDPIDYVVNIRW